MLSVKRSLLAPLALLAGIALAMTGCAIAPPGGAEPSSSTSGSASPPPVSVESGVVNALDSTGPVAAETVPDMQPVVSSATPVLPATVKDSTDKTIEVASAQRVLALDLYGTLTDTIIGLGLQDLLVGRANSDTQAVLKELPIVTRGGHDLNTEAVLNLHPDLVLTNTTIGAESNYRQLEAVGVTVVRFEQVPHISAIRDTVEMVGDVFGLPQAAAELAEHIDDQLQQARGTIEELRAATPRPPRAIVLYIRGTAGVFFILGADYGASDVLDFIGLEDVAAESGIGNLTPANPEALVSLDPEIILAMEQGVESTGGIAGLLDRPGVAATTAGSNERIVTAPDTQLLSYGPRTPASLIALARAIYTDGR